MIGNSKSNHSGAQGTFSSGGKGKSGGKGTSADTAMDMNEFRLRVSFRRFDDRELEVESLRRTGRL